MTSPIYLKTENKTIPVTLTQTATGFLIVANQFEFELVCSLADFQAVIAQPLPRRNLDVLSMTPLDVVCYFEQSPVLNYLADDLRTSILHSSEAQYPTYQVDDDLQAIKHLKSPSKADIAEILLGNRTYGGAGYKRVKAAFDAFYTSTTPAERPEAPEVENQAA